MGVFRRYFGVGQRVCYLMVGVFGGYSDLSTRIYMYCSTSDISGSFRFAMVIFINLHKVVVSELLVFGWALVGSLRSPEHSRPRFIFNVTIL